jgi:hypothetical protein
MKTRFLPLLAAVLFAFASPSEAARVALDLRAPAGGAVSSAVPQGPSCLRSAVLPPGAAAAAPLAAGDTVDFLLFDGTSFSVTLAERMESPLGGEAFLGEVAGCGGVKNAVVLQTPEGLFADIQDFARGRVYTVVSDASGVTVRELDPGVDAVVATEPVAPPLSDGPLACSAAPAPDAGVAADQASTLVDVLVAYDTPAAEWARQNGGGITNFATMAVEKMNTALANSGLAESFRFRLVGVLSVAAEGGTDLDGVLEATYRGTGDWAPVKAMRDEVGADVVTTLIDTGSASGTTGLGFSLKNRTPAAFADSAYNVCAVRAVAQSHTMTHETGHNLGAGHASAVDPEKISPGPQLYDYSAGHFFTGTNGVAYHTIMAYYYDGFGNTYSPAPFFSSPDCFFMGAATGDATHDNVRTLRETCAAASQWRAQVVPMAYDVYFSPAGGSTFTDSLVVTLAPGKAGLPIRYTLDGSEPTLSSLLYTGPLTLTETTTIRAATVTDGVLGPVFEATYSVSDLGAALDAPHLAWRTSDSHPWFFETTDTYDGTDAAQSTDDGGYWENESWLETTVEGPAEMSFRYRTRKYRGTFSVLLDGKAVLTDTEETTSETWILKTVSIPEGEHDVRFRFQCWIETEDGRTGGRYSPGFNGAWLDTVQFDAVSRPPAIAPVTTGDEATATTFQYGLEVVFFLPAGAVGNLFYTLDGSDPTGEGALVYYGGSLVLTNSTRLRAVFVEDGKDPSEEVGGLYLERHPVQPGEWTTDVAGAQAAAARDGRLVAVLLASRETCWHSQRFQPVAESEEFLAWARSNGVYLVTADSSCHVDAGAAEDWFWDLCYAWTGRWSAAYPQLYFVVPPDFDTPVGEGLARNDGESFVGTELYLGTAESLIAGFASVLAAVSPQAVEIEGVAVPCAWLDGHFPGEGGSAEAYEALALADADGDGFPAWQEYLLATDPTNAASRLVATLRLEGTDPVFGWDPTNAALADLGFRYVPQGRASLAKTAGDWHPLEEGDTFFRVSVEPLP